MLLSDWIEPSEAEKLALRRANRSSQRRRKYMSGKVTAVKPVTLAPLKWMDSEPK